MRRLEHVRQLAVAFGRPVDRRAVQLGLLDEVDGDRRRLTGQQARQQLVIEQPARQQQPGRDDQHRQPARGMDSS